MPDDNDNLIPDRYDKVIALALTGLVSLLVIISEGGWFGAEVTVWLQRAIAVIAVLSSVFRWGVVARRSKVAGATLVCLGLASSSCTPSLSDGYRAITVVRTAGDTTGRSLATVCKARRLDCAAKHGLATEAGKACVRPCAEALRTWVKYTRPAVNAALVATYGGLETARAKKAEAPWMQLIKPAACALIKALGELKELLGKQAESILGAVSGIGKVVCP